MAKFRAIKVFGDKAVFVVNLDHIIYISPYYHTDFKEDWYEIYLTKGSCLQIPKGKNKKFLSELIKEDTKKRGIFG